MHALKNFTRKMGGGHILLKISTPFRLIKTFRMNLILLDSTFKYCLLICRGAAFKACWVVQVTEHTDFCYADMIV
jgi:hypothetical protein